MQRTNIVSIHATLAGGDKSTMRSVYTSFWFLSTPPSRVATTLLLTIHQLVMVSIHATLAGGDIERRNSYSFIFRFLSTPPSRVATSSTAFLIASGSCFYPRHPRGWRRLADSFTALNNTLFLSTPPSRVATFKMGDPPNHQQVSIHATLAGGDVKSCNFNNSNKEFLSTPPSRVATSDSGRKFRFGYVSIHATLAGGDEKMAGLL